LTGRHESGTFVAMTNRLFRLSPAALILAALLPAVARAQEPEPIAPVVPAAALPLAAPTGEADLALIVHWIQSDVSELYGFALRSGRAQRPLHVQLAVGQPRFRTSSWIAGASVDLGRPLVRNGTTRVFAAAGGQVLYDRRDNDLNVRVPVVARGETSLPLGELVSLAPLFAAGAALGVARIDDWSEYAGIFGEAGVRLTVYGVWAQGSIALDRRVLGDDGEPTEPRFVLRIGFIPREPANRR
jgi:hypothetical protein